MVGAGTTDGGDAMASRTYDLLDSPEAVNVLFFPRRDAFVPEPSATVRPVSVRVDHDVAVGGRLFPAGPEAPVILYFHGNGEIASDYDYLSHLYTGLGISLLVMDFRGYGTSDGWPTASTLIADAGVIYDRTREVLAAEGIAADVPLFVMGRSLGSASALEIASRAGDAIAGLIIESGFAHTLELIARLGGRPLDGDEARDGFGNLEKIAGTAVPTLVLHGLEDWIIPVEDGRALHGHAGAADKTLIEIPGAGHNDILLVGQRVYFESVRSLVFGGGAAG